MSIPAVLRQHLRESAHDIQMQPVQLLVEALRVARALRSENRYSVTDVLFFLCGDAGKGFSQTARSDLPDAGVAREGEGFEHDLLDDQAADKVARVDAAQERAAQPLPMLCFDVIGDVHSDLASL